MNRSILLLLVCGTSISLSAPERTYSEAEAKTLGWPSLQGPFGNFLSARTGAALVDDLSQAKLVWESEDADMGRAKHTTGTFKKAGNITRHLGPEAESHPGGWAGVIVAEGKVFGTSFRPSGKVVQVENPMIKTVEPGRIEAEDLLIAIDAETGKTAWKAVERGGFVWGVGKRQGFQVAPACHQGTVFSMGTTGRVFAYDAETGKKLWERPALPSMIETRDKYFSKPSVMQVTSRYAWQQSLSVAGGVLILPRGSTLVGVEVKSGKTLWELGGTKDLRNVISRHATPSVWRHGNKEYLLAATVAAPGQAQLRLIDPKDGAVLWTVGGLDATPFSLAHSGNHVLVNVGGGIPTKGNASAPKDENGQAYYGRLGAYRISPEGAKRVWTLPNEPRYAFPTWMDAGAMRRTLIRDGLVYFVSSGPDKEKDRGFFIIDEDTGKVLAEQAGDRSKRGYTLLIEDRLLVSPDWAHGGRGAFFDLYTADPGDFRKLSGNWRGAKPFTTAYTVFLKVPVVAGRLFLRTEPGHVLCYDLRKMN